MVIIIGTLYYVEHSSGVTCNSFEASLVIDVSPLWRTEAFDSSLAVMAQITKFAFTQINGTLPDDNNFSRPSSSLYRRHNCPVGIFNDSDRPLLIDARDAGARSMQPNVQYFLVIDSFPSNYIFCYLFLILELDKT